jgi:uncharacterized membrane protein YesL
MNLITRIFPSVTTLTLLLTSLCCSYRLDSPTTSVLFTLFFGDACIYMFFVSYSLITFLPSDLSSRNLIKKKLSL